MQTALKLRAADQQVEVQRTGSQHGTYYGDAPLLFTFIRKGSCPCYSTKDGRKAAASRNM